MLRQPSQSSTMSGPADGDLRIDHRHQRHPLLVVVVVVGARREAGHEQADALVHLRRGEADALILGHRLEHVVDQLLDARRLDLADVDRPAHGARSTGWPMRATFRIDIAAL